jgi:uncharacterized protein (DUF1697 family)
MAELRRRLHQAGHEDAITYLQSGNVVLRSELEAEALAREFQARLAEWFGLEVPAMVRSGAELALVVEGNPLAGSADDPKRHQVSFLAEPAPAGLEAELRQLCAGAERVEVRGREIHAWHPDGIQHSKLARALAAAKLGATARNWRTVTALAAMAAP